MTISKSLSLKGSEIILTLSCFTNCADPTQLKFQEKCPLLELRLAYIFVVFLKKPKIELVVHFECQFTLWSVQLGKWDAKLILKKSWQFWSFLKRIKTRMSNWHATTLKKLILLPAFHHPNVTLSNGTFMTFLVDNIVMKCHKCKTENKCEEVLLCNRN